MSDVSKNILILPTALFDSAPELTEALAALHSTTLTELPDCDDHDGWDQLLTQILDADLVISL